ncbi:hypothetical protein BGZ82_000553 [Podila clonocystis]|nr:hypothetical protein BGZ82_000553 [Podila clonocystis]
MSQGSCINYCKTNQYQYAITEDGTSCFCTNESPSEKNRVEDTRCDKPCAGYPFEMCGSETIHDSGVVGSAYANVLLVGNSLKKTSTSIPGNDGQSKPSDVPVIASLKPEVRQDHEQGTQVTSREPDKEEEDGGENEDEDEDEDGSSGENEENDGDEEIQGIEGDSGKAIHGGAIGAPNHLGGYQ